MFFVTTTGEKANAFDGGRSKKTAEAAYATRIPDVLIIFFFFVACDQSISTAMQRSMCNTVKAKSSGAASTM